MQDNNSETTEQKVKRVKDEIQKLFQENDLIGVAIIGLIEDSFIPDSESHKQLQLSHCFMAEAKYSGFKLKDGWYEETEQKLANNTKNCFYIMGNLFYSLLDKFLKI